SKPAYRFNQGGPAQGIDLILHLIDVGRSDVGLEQNALLQLDTISSRHDQHLWRLLDGEKERREDPADGQRPPKWVGEPLILEGLLHRFPETRFIVPTRNSELRGYRTFCRTPLSRLQG